MDIAMKELLIGFDILEESILKEFLIEIKLLSALHHPNIVQFLGVSCPSPSKLYLITVSGKYYYNGILTQVILSNRN